MDARGGNPSPSPSASEVATGVIQEAQASAHTFTFAQLC